MHYTTKHMQGHWIMVSIQEHETHLLWAVDHGNNTTVKCLVEGLNVDISKFNEVHKYSITCIINDYGYSIQISLVCSCFTM